MKAHFVGRAAWEAVIGCLVAVCTARAESLSEVIRNSEGRPAMTPASAEKPSNPNGFGISGFKTRNLLSMIVENGQGQALGAVREVALDSHSGRLIYVAISSGGLFGMGRPWRAVPPGALSVSATKHAMLVLDVALERWRQSPMFHKDSLADLASDNMRHVVYRYYRQSLPDADPAEVTAGDNLVQASSGDPASLPRKDGHGVGGAPALQLTGDLLGRVVTNRQDERFGLIVDLLVDLAGQKESLALIEAGGVLKQKTRFAVATRAFHIFEGGHKARLDASAAMFRDARPFQVEQWPASTAEGFEVWRFAEDNGAPADRPVYLSLAH